MNVTMYAVLAGMAVSLGSLIWTLHLRQRAATDTLDARLAHLTAGIALLTDTAETGLGDVARELARRPPAAAEPARSTRAASQRRVVAASRRGRSVNDIAAEEQMSESEVRLRMKLDKTRKGANHASMR